MEGWIKLHRSLMAWEWWQDDKMLRVFLTILLNANHDNGRWQGHDVKRGQWITGRKKLSEMTNVSERSIRTILKRLTDSEEITVKSTSKFSLITVVNWDSYQVSEKENDQQVTNKRPASDQQVTTNKNVKNDKNEKKNIYGEFQNVKLTDNEHQKLFDKLNGSADDYIERVSTYIEQSGKKYNSHYATILAWKRKDEKQNTNYDNRPMKRL